MWLKALPKLRFLVQEKFKSYVENGSIYIFKPEVMIKNSVRFGGNIGIYRMEKWQSIDIDNQDDFVEAENIFKSRLNYE